MTATSGAIHLWHRRGATGFNMRRRTAFQLVWFADWNIRSTKHMNFVVHAVAMHKASQISLADGIPGSTMAGHRWYRAPASYALKIETQR